MRIGLTGGIGSGKSTVAAVWAELGATVIDTDAISRELTAAGGAAMPALIEAFGPQLATPEGALDREAMRALAFNNVDVKRRLEAVLHPMIGAEAAARAEAARSEFIVFDVPLLVESGRWRRRVNRVLVIDCEEQTQRERVLKRSGWNEAAVMAVIQTQATRAQRRAAADAVICNEGLSLSDLHAQITALARCWGQNKP